MKTKCFRTWILLWILAGAVPLISSDKYKIVNGPEDSYFGHISFTESKFDGKDPLVWREGAQGPEPVVLNMPLGPGDVIRTTDSRRCEIQFDTGTIVRLDVSTKLKIETIFAKSLSRRNGISNLELAQGRIYIMYKRYDSREVFQVLTANAAMKLKQNTVALIRTAEDGSTDLQVRRGRATALFGPEARKAKSMKIGKLQRLIVLGNDEFQTAPYIADTDFEKWNEEMNADFLDLHKGKNVLPKPVQRLPRAVFNFAQKFGNRYGEWLWDDLYGYIWRPYYNDNRYPWGNWQPYLYGRWAAYQGQMFWVPEEPWGWVPYHLGIWQWDQKLGWVWLPGSLFASAWATWDFYFGTYAWRPMSMWDFFTAADIWLSSQHQYNFMNSWRDPENPIQNQDKEQILNKIRKDQLKKGDKASNPMPKEFKKIIQSVSAALKKNDDRVLESLKRVPDQFVFVQQNDLISARIKEKALTWSQVKKLETGRDQTGSSGISRNPALEALRIIKRNQEVLQAPQGSSPAMPEPSSSLGFQRVGNPGFDRSAKPISRPGDRSDMRFRDWNPDVKIAQRLGVDIRYSSATNEVRCPELKISSRSVNANGIGLSHNGVSSSSFNGGNSSSVSSRTDSAQSSRGDHADHSEAGHNSGTASTRKD